MKIFFISFILASIGLQKVSADATVVSTLCPIPKVHYALDSIQPQSNIFYAQTFQWTVNPEQKAKVRFEKGKNSTSADVDDQAAARNYVFAQ